MLRWRHWGAWTIFHRNVHVLSLMWRNSLVRLLRGSRGFSSLEKYNFSSKNKVEKQFEKNSWNWCIQCRLHSKMSNTVIQSHSYWRKFRCVAVNFSLCATKWLIIIPSNQLFINHYKSLILRNVLQIGQCAHIGNLLSFIFWQKFRENDVFTNKITKQSCWFDEKTFGDSEFFNLVSLITGFFFREINYLSILVVFTNF